MTEKLIKIEQYTHQAYLDYAMYVILDRALPNIGDGLKPVQRRIIYAMSELGLKASAKFKKSARTVGDVIGKFHPHGDSACYEAMVLMAQDFSYRYPIVEGHGNWGSPDDPKSFAAMRYTESKLTAYAEVLLKELSQGTAEWQPNFDGSLREPVILPARMPNILLNGASGIAVGMATDILPHNLTEVGNALIHLIENPQASIEDLLQYIKGPDFPTGAEIISSASEIKELYKTGSGLIKQRASYRQEDKLVIFEKLPFQASSSKLVKQIADQMQQKKLPAVTDVRDESDHENAVRLVVELRTSRANQVQEVVSHLFASTDLEKGYRANFNMIGIDRKPAVKNILEILSEWLVFRKQIVRKRLEFSLEKVVNRLHILEGLLLVFIHIDEIIKVIRKSDQPKADLMAQFKLTEIQAEAILEMKLRQLANLEYIALENEQKDLQEKEKELKALLSNEAKFNQLIVRELQEVIDEHGDARRCPLVVREEAKLIKVENLIPSYKLTVILSESGWIKGAKTTDLDVSSLTFRGDDKLKATAVGSSQDQCVVLTEAGRVFNLAMHQVPSSRGYGEPISKYLELNSPIVGIVVAEKKRQWLIYSSFGYGFILNSDDLLVRQKAGKQLFNLKDGEKIRLLTPLDDAQDILLVSGQGRALAIKVADVAVLPKGRGVKLMGIKKSDLDKGYDELSYAMPFKEGQNLEILSGQRMIRMDRPRMETVVGARGTRGKMLPQGFRQVSGIKKIIDEQESI